ncbi:hypothetical protein D3C81_1685810 [compost metagenome]
MQAAEAAVAHDHHLGAGRGLRLDLFDDRLQRVADLRRNAAQRGGGGQVPAEVRRRVPVHLVGLQHAVRQAVAVGAELHGIGARLDDRDHRRIANAFTQTVEGGGDGGRVVGEVVIDSHAVHLGDLLHAPLHALEARQPGDAQFRHHADMPCRRKAGQRVGDVVLAGQFPLHGAL